jgi:Kef-type K+ transport system membrane component KefB
MLLLIAAILLAVVTKIVGGGIGAWVGGFTGRALLQIGVGIVSRGEVALVIASAGLAAGLLDRGIFSVLIVVTLATTLITPPLLRVVFAKEQATR